MRFISRSLSRRIVASVALGLTLILLLFGLVALFRINESMENAYYMRVMLAETLVARFDDVLRYYLAALEREAADLGSIPNYQLTELRPRLGGSLAVAAIDYAGRAYWADPAEETEAGSHVSKAAVDLVLSTGASQVTELVDPARPDRVYACLAVPVRDRSGRITGVLAAEFDPSLPALSLLPSGRVGANTLAQLVNMQGKVLDGTRLPNPKSEVEHQTLLADLMEARKAGYRMHEPALGDRFPMHVVAYAPSLALPSWGITVEQPTDVVLAMPRQLLERQILFGVAALLLAIAVTWFDVRRVVRPLRRLTSIAEHFAAGHLDEPVDIKREDEIGILANAFDTMRVRLRTLLAEVADWNRELERRVAARTAEVERRNRELAHLNAIATALGASLDVKSMLERTLDNVLQMTAADSGCFWMVEDEGESMTLAAQRGPLDVLETQGRRGCLCHRAARLNRVLLANEEDLDPEESPCGAAGLRSAVAVPVSWGKSVRAVLMVASSRPDCFRDVETATLTAIARQVGVAVENALLYEEVQRKEELRGQLLEKVIVAQEDERKRVARELHDQLAQELPALIMSLDAVKRSLPQEARQAEETIERAQGVASVTLGEVRKMILDLRPSALDDLGLVPAIRWYGERYLEERGIKFECHAVGFRKRLPAQLETALFRIVQEAINNIIKHAQAKKVRVHLERKDSKVCGLVEDDGKGFDLSRIHRGVDGLEGLGLLGMQERVALFGGVFSLKSEVGKGTQIIIEVPLRAEADSSE